MSASEFEADLGVDLYEVFPWPSRGPNRVFLVLQAREELNECGGQDDRIPDLVHGLACLRVLAGREGSA